MPLRFSARRRALLAVAASAAALAAAPVRAARALTVERLGARLHVETRGEGPPVLLLHGGLGHSGWFDALAARLAGAGRTAVLVDTRGMGRSSLGDAALSYATQEADALAVLDALGIARCPVIGFSDGRIAGYRLAAGAPDRVSALVTIGSRWSAENGRAMWPAFDSWSRESLSAGDFRFIAEDYDRLSPDGDFDRMMRQAAAMWKDDGPQGHPGAGRLARVACPTLVSVGDRDPFLSVADAQAGRAQVRDASLFVLPDAGHAAYRERADLFDPALDAFLAARA
jgi:pimeloyl-ACP methyl ester carboxylesterase